MVASKAQTARRTKKTRKKGPHGVDYKRPAQTRKLGADWITKTWGYNNGKKGRENDGTGGEP